MATGYTADVQDGTITEFKDFALKCARAMGTNIMMKDDPLSKPIRKYEPSSYHKDRLEETQEELHTISGMTTEEIQIEADKEFEQDKKRLEEGAKEKREQLVRYTNMLEQVKKWEPPTEGHESFKKFMIDQLEESIEFDCGDYYERALEELIAPPSYDEWREGKIKDLKESIVYHRKHYREEVSRTQKRNDWNENLITSLDK